jgi:histidinol-phosphate aminotransferase
MSDPLAAAAAARAAQLIRPDLRARSAYQVPDATGLVKLDAMENPHRLPEPLRREIAALAADAELNRYPDATAAALRAALRSTYAVPQDMDILVGNGSDELIQLLALAVARPGATLLALEPSFVMFRLIADHAGLRYAGVRLGGGFAIDPERTLRALREHRPALTFIANPNNPTGNLFDPAAIRAIVEAAPGLVVIDEAYGAFCDSDWLPELNRHANLLVMRTLSKLGLAGLRLGLLVGRPQWLAELDKLRLPYNVGTLTQCIATRLLAHYGALAAQAAEIRAERARLSQALAALPGVHVYPSQANFVLFRVTDADGVHASLRAAGVLIKNVSAAHPMLAGCLRASVGTAAENERLLCALAAALRRPG